MDDEISGQRATGLVVGAILLTLIVNGLLLAGGVWLVVVILRAMNVL